MKSFPSAVAGFFDVEDQLSRYLIDRSRPQFAAEREAKRARDSRSEFEARTERVRETFLERIGGLPPRPADLPVEQTDVLDRDGYSVALLTIESRPNFHVTANCYVPDGDGPHPAVLFCCGHVREAKADPYNQRACIELARNGFVVLVFDPIGQGERVQFAEPESNEMVVHGGGGAFDHCYLGQQYAYAGANLARAMIHDGRCGLDYLAGRPDVDENRLAVTGTSGGGLQTTYLALLDDRIAAAAPCCAVTEREEWLQTGKRIDAEQLVYGAIQDGINYDDLLAGFAPKPLCIGAATWDEYFPIEGLHEAVERIRRVYDHFDAAENVELVVAEEPHCSVYELGDGVFEWLCEQLGNGEFESHDDLAAVDETDLWCTPEGSVLKAYSDERTTTDLVREFVAENEPADGRQPASSTDGSQTGTSTDGSQAQLQERAVQKFDLDRDRPTLRPRIVGTVDHEGLDLSYVCFKTERNPDIVVTGVLVSEPETETDVPAVVCFERGTEELPERAETVAELAREYGTVFVFDPRGVGAVRNRTIPIPPWLEDDDGVYGTEFKLGYDALLLSDSLFGMRVYDVCRATDFLQSNVDCECSIPR